MASVKTGVLKSFANFTGKHLRWRPRQRCFPVQFENFKNTYLEEHLRMTAPVYPALVL